MGMRPAECVSAADSAGGFQCYRVKRFAMPTINQLVRKPRRPETQVQQGSGVGSSPSKSRACASSYRTIDAEKAELGPAENRTSAAQQRQGSHGIHPGRRPQPSRALDRAGPGRAVFATCGRALPGRSGYAGRGRRGRSPAIPQSLRGQETRQIVTGVLLVEQVTDFDEDAAVALDCSRLSIPVCCSLL